MRKGKIAQATKEELEKLVNEKNSLTEILQNFGLMNKGSNFRTLKNKLIKENIDFSSLKLKAKKANRNSTKKTFDEIFCENSSMQRGGVKKVIIKNKLIQYECKVCGLKDEWKNQKLVLILDHINGVSNDNRLHNLRFLCPNCNSQQETFAGKNYKPEKITQQQKKINKSTECSNCGQFCSKRSKSLLCRKCYLETINNYNYPQYDELKKMVDDIGYSATGRKLGVSDNAVRKRLNKNCGVVE